MKSDKLLHYLGKYFFLLFSLTFFLIGVKYAVEGFQLKEWNVDAIIGFALPAVFFLILFLYLKDKFAIIEFGNQRLKIFSDKEIIEVSWLEVESIEPFRFSSPPIYILRLTNRDGFFLFGTSQGAFTVGGLIVDDSDIGNLIDKKKRELDI